MNSDSKPYRPDMSALAANEPLVPLSVYGAGGVGLVTAACFAELGHVVLCVDADIARVTQLARGQLPFVEPGLEDLMVRNGRRGRLRFTNDADAAVAHGAVHFIAVGTPCQRDGTVDTRQVLEVARRIGAGLPREALVVCQSTVPVGTTHQVEQVVHGELVRRGMRELRFSVAVNPGFLREGSAVQNFMQPDRVLVGADDAQAIELLRRLYAPLIRRPEQWLAMATRGAELAKYACSAMLASRLSMMNELARLADALQVDIEDVRLGLAGDTRIGPACLSPGCGFGGSCLPKDTRALQRIAQDHGVALPIMAAVEQTNQQQKGLLARLTIELLGAPEGDEQRGTGPSVRDGGPLAGRRIALWGLAFKPGTDDLREAPSVVLIDMLTAAGATVVAHDPVAMPAARRQHGHLRSLRFAVDALDAVDGADALLIATEWPQYRQVDWSAVRARMARPNVFDGRNVCDPARMQRLGFAYRGIGRGQFEKIAATPAVASPRAREPTLRNPLPAAGPTRVHIGSRA